MHKIFKFCVNLTNYQNVIKYNRPEPLMYLSARCCSTASLTQKGSAHQRSKTTTGSTNFDDMLKKRRLQASQSVLVQVNSEKSFAELYTYCSQFGTIMGSHHYTHDDMHYILLEYSSANEAAAAIRSSTFNEATSGIVVYSPFLWFRAGPRSKAGETVEKPLFKTATLNVIDGNRAADDSDVNERLQSAQTVADQMKILYQTSCLNDIGIRLRFLAARQIEQSLSGMFPSVQAWPFGSSVNGFGRLGCDLDLILRLTSADDKSNPASRLVYHTKENLSNGRSQTQRQMECISDMMQLFLPGVCHVRRILQARVPIIKFHHEHLDLEVDLSMSNLTGVYMSELLYMFGQIDERVMPLVFTVRRWAQAVGLTNPSPGRWISNFSLTCLVIYYLQQTSTPVLPSINMLVEQARRPDDVHITEDGINCTFLRDLHRLQFATTNHTGLERLLIEFFEFYSVMDFTERAISLNEARSIMKPDHSPMYIMNPLELQLNICKNISSDECERFRIEVRNAAWALDSYSTQSANSKWGLLALTKQSQTAIRPSMFFKSRMVDVSELFENEKSPKSESQPKKQLQSNHQPTSETNHMQLSQPQRQVKAVEYKNYAIKQEVEKIKRKGQKDVQQMCQSVGIDSDGDGGGGGGGGGSNSIPIPSRVRKR